MNPHHTVDCQMTVDYRLLPQELTLNAIINKLIANSPVSFVLTSPDMPESPLPLLSEGFLWHLLHDDLHKITSLYTIGKRRG